MSDPIWTRRDVLELAAALAAAPVAAARDGAASPADILPGLRLLPNSVNTALFERNGRRLLIDSGEVEKVPGGSGADWVLVTHHHRDQAARLHLLAARGVRIAVPALEERYFSNARGFWDGADTILDHRYDFRPHVFTPRDSVRVSRALRGGEVFEWEGLRFEVLDTPGHTDGSVTYLVEIAGKRVAFTGDLIAAPGQIWEMWSLQKRWPGMRGDYWGFGGAVEEVKASLGRVLKRRPDMFIPSHGEVIRDPPAAVAALRRNLDAFMENYLKTAAWRIYFEGIYPKDRPPMFPSLPAVSYPKWIRNIAATTKAIVADDGSVFLSDCGHPSAIEELQRLRASKEIGAVEGIWITHYHDDHTQEVNRARQRFGAKVYVQREMVDIIENPTAHSMPCLFPESIRVDQVLEDRETIHWKEFRLTAFHFPGQTLYHTGLLVERGGVRAFFTGDSFANWGIDDYCSQNRCFLGRGAGYDRCFRILLETRPDVLIAAHWGPLPVSHEYLQKSIALLEERQRLASRLFPHENPNFGLDPGWIRAYPHRQKTLPGASVSVEARIYNHAGAPRNAVAELRLPEGWRAVRGSRTIRIPAGSEGRVRLEAVAPRRPPGGGRSVLGLAVTFEGRPLGEFAEAIVDFLD
ncbi:MAG: MBL fold metallo-hydrolase [Chloroflexi bacterium]|nr:MBL fold metallo-hydrolase [Chloroflexota bacterium]